MGYNMKKLFITFAILAPLYANAGIYTNSENFRPYIGVEIGLNIADYATRTNLDEQYYSATINAGARMGRNFGLEFFFTHSGDNELEFVSSYDTINHLIYYMGYGFDIYGYYEIIPDFEFFTTFGVANYSFYDDYEHLGTYTSTSEKLSENQVTTRLGIGLIYTFPDDHVSGVFRYQYTPINLDIIRNMNEFSVGLRYTF